jgi:hypothetical protein
MEVIMKPKDKIVVDGQTYFIYGPKKYTDTKGVPISDKALYMKVHQAAEQQAADPNHKPNPEDVNTQQEQQATQEQQAADEEPATGGAVGTTQNILNGINQFGVSLQGNAGNKGFSSAKDPGTAGREGRAELYDKHGAEMAAKAQGEIQRGNRNINAEASERAATQSAAENAQNVRNLSGAAGGGAAALSRKTATPDVGAVKSENAELRKTGFEQQKNADTAFRAAQTERQMSAEKDAAYADKQRLETEARSIAKGNPMLDKGPDDWEDATPDNGPDEEAEKVTPDEEATVDEHKPMGGVAPTGGGEVPTEPTPATAGPSEGEPTKADTAPPEKVEEANARVTNATEDLPDPQKYFKAGVEAFLAGDEAYAKWAESVNQELGLTGTKALGPKRNVATAGRNAGNFDTETGAIVTSKYAQVPGNQGNQDNQGNIESDIRLKKIVSDYRLKHKPNHLAAAIKKAFLC